MADRRRVIATVSFLDGTNTDVIHAIANAVLNVGECKVFTVEADTTPDNTIYTLIGSPDSVIAAVMKMAQAARERIDMSNRKADQMGLGVLDMCIFSPALDVNVDDCVHYSKRFAKTLAEEFEVPVYLVLESTNSDRVQQWRQLPSKSDRMYSTFQQKLETPQWTPDYGPTTFVPAWGGSFVGASDFIPICNFNLIGTRKQAMEIAKKLRTSSGRLPSVKAIGWMSAKYDVAQVAAYLLDINSTPMHVFYEACLQECQLMQVPHCGSDVVGMIHLRSLLEAADYFRQKEGLPELDESGKVKLAIHRLGLSFLRSFIPKDRIIEYAMQSI